MQTAKWKDIEATDSNTKVFINTLHTYYEQPSPR
jgi:hypothetical protein